MPRTIRGMPARPVDSVASMAGPTLRGWHQAIRAQFLVLGLAMGAWGAQVPSVKSHYGLSEQALSIALLAAAAGAVLCLFSAGRLVARFGARRCIRGAGLVMLLSLLAVLAGMALALSVGAPWAALLGFMLVGLGLANVVPVLQAAAAQVPGVSAAAGVAAVSSIGYMGIMVGPPLGRAGQRSVARHGALGGGAVRGVVGARGTAGARAARQVSRAAQSSSSALAISTSSRSIASFGSQAAASA